MFANQNVYNHALANHHNWRNKQNLDAHYSENESSNSHYMHILQFE